MERVRSVVTVVGVLVLEASALVAVWTMGSARWATIGLDRPDVWLRTSPATDVAAATGRLLALSGLAWLLTATLMQVAVALPSAGSGGGRRIPGLPAVLRRRIETSIAALVATGTLAAPGIAVAVPGLPDHIPVPVPRDVIASHDDVPAPPPIIAPPAPRQAPTPPNPPADPGPEVVPDSATATRSGVHTVVAGEHLWAIAQRHLRTAVPDASTHEVAAYWREVVAANGDLTSGDPNLIYPGEHVALPPL